MTSGRICRCCRYGPDIKLCRRSTSWLAVAGAVSIYGRHEHRVGHDSGWNHAMAACVAARWLHTRSAMGGRGRGIWRGIIDRAQGQTRGVRGVYEGRGFRLTPVRVTTSRPGLSATAHGAARRIAVILGTVGGRAGAGRAPCRLRDAVSRLYVYLSLFVGRVGKDGHRPGGASSFRRKVFFLSTKTKK
jgi:hypothetical protein